MLRDFVQGHREEILSRARARVAERGPRAAEQVAPGLGVFLDQLCVSLLTPGERGAQDHSALATSAHEHGNHLFTQGFTAGQVVHDYGDLCQVITGLALEHKLDVGADEFQTLNLCLDDAIAGAVTAFGDHRERAVEEASTERLGFFAHEMRNVLNTAMLSFTAIKRGIVSPGGSTGTILERNLLTLQQLIDRSLADVRLESGLHDVQRIPVWEILEEVAVGAMLVAEGRGLVFVKETIDHDVVVLADRQILAAAISNLLQNALKFTQPATRVTLRALSSDTRVLIEVEDECGGLPPGPTADLLSAFGQRGKDRTGLGLGLAICVKAAKSMNGDLHVRDLPGKGCIFALDLPKQPAPPRSIFTPRPKARPTGAGRESGPASKKIRRVV
ncbi:MAG: Sensory box histidine kinase/response regulator [Labilithrix sp.]|nr:Sensory box histidine kinase/response regulator [Labilithrix sp.]